MVMQSFTLLMSFGILTPVCVNQNMVAINFRRLFSIYILQCTCVEHKWGPCFSSCPMKSFLPLSYEWCINTPSSQIGLYQPLLIINYLSQLILTKKSAMKSVKQIHQKKSAMKFWRGVVYVRFDVSCTCTPKIAKNRRMVY